MSTTHTDPIGAQWQRAPRPDAWRLKRLRYVLVTGELVNDDTRPSLSLATAARKAVVGCTTIKRLADEYPELIEIRHVEYEAKSGSYGASHKVFAKRVYWRGK